jgi:hypothetical protein
MTQTMAFWFLEVDFTTHKERLKNMSCSDITKKRKLFQREKPLCSSMSSICEINSLVI